MRFDRVAITGGSGRLGAFVTEELRTHCDVTVLDLTPPAHDVRFEQIDVMDRERLHTALESHDAVVHLAGIDLDTVTTPDAYLRVNTLGTWNVLEAAQDHGIKRCALCSSITATGLHEARADFSPLYLPVDEDHPCAPVHAYGVSKQIMETMATSFARRGSMEIVNLRPMLVMLPHNFTLIRDRAADHSCRWLFYYVSPGDVACAFRCALEARELPFSTYFVTARDSCHEKPTLEWFETALGALPDIRKPEIYAQHPRASVFDGSRAREILDFSPTSNWLTLDRNAP